MSADRIVDVVWGEEPLRDPANAAQAKIAQFRRVLEPSQEGGPRQLGPAPAPGRT